MDHVTLRRPALVAQGVLVLVAAGCGFGGSGEIKSEGSWQRLPDPPLSPRELAAGVWTGSDALIIGGSDARPTPPGAGSLAKPKPPLRDGAAFDPRTRSWRAIAPAPVGIEPVSRATVVGGSVYVAVPRNPGVCHPRMDLLAYRLRADRWDRLPSPPRRNYSLVGIAGRLLAAGPERGPVPLSLFQLGPRERRWKELPRPPMRGTITWNGRRMVLIGFDPAARNAENPPLARAATLRFGDNAWRRLPDSDHVLWGHGFWIRVGMRLVSPELGIGGEDFAYGRPYGGILDPERGVWSELPNVPQPTERTGAEFGTGVLTRSRLVGGAPSLLVLDMTTEDWIRVPPLWRGRSAPLGWTTVNARRKLLVFGGARWNRAHPDGQLLNDAWLWTPPAP
jgi:hypothetical protein